MKLHIPPEPLGLKLQMQKLFLSQAESAEDRKEWREAIQRTKKDIRKFGLYRKVPTKN